MDSKKKTVTKKSTVAVPIEEPAPKAKPKAEPKSESKPKAEPKPETKTKSVAKPEPKAEPKLEPKPEPKAKSAKPKAAPEPEVESDDESDTSDDTLDFDNLSDYESEDDEDDESQTDEEVDTSKEAKGGDDAVFDLDKFKKGKVFDQEAAEKEFIEWKSKRVRKQPSWFQSIEVPDINEDEFVKQRKAMTQRLIDAYKVKLAKVEADLAESGLTKKELKELNVLKQQYMDNIAARERELK